MQKEILARITRPDLRVYAVWFNMMRSDDRRWWRKELLDDPRVTHLWDDKQATGRWYGDHVTRPGEDWVEWDAWFLYGPDASWQDKPTPPLGWGRTIMATREKLAAAVQSLPAP